MHGHPVEAHRASHCWPLAAARSGSPAWLLLRGSLPRSTATITLPGLSAPVTIQRDHLGVVTVDAANEIDAMRALGYVHAQERFFEMDLMRRTAAGRTRRTVRADRGENGPAASRAPHARTRATQDLPAIAGGKLGLLNAYVGRRQCRACHASRFVRGLTCCCARSRVAWQPADTPLVGYAMYFDLQDASNKREAGAVASAAGVAASRCSRCWRAMARRGMRR